MALLLCAPLQAEEYGLEVLALEPLFGGGVQPWFGSDHGLSFYRMRGDRRASNPDHEYDFVHRFTAGVNYGVPREIPGDFTLSAFVPVVYRDFRVRSKHGVVGDQIFGLGDIGLFARGRYLWWVPGDASERSISLSLSGGVELPTGPSGLERDGITVPRPYQPGRGGYSITAAHLAAVGIGKLWYGGRLDLGSALRVRINSVGVGGSGYDFGDELSHEFTFKLRVIQEKPYPGNTMFVGFGLIYHSRTPDVDNGRRVHDTGLREVVIKPWVAWHPRPWDIFLIEARVPLYRQANGTQLVEGIGFFVSYGRRF
jgi:hypothetical protein